MIRFFFRRIRGAISPRVLLSVFALVFMIAAMAAPSFAAGGQTGNAAGTVQDQAGKPIPGATIALVSPSGSFKQSTDAAGRFTFFGIPVDTYTVSVEAKGFEPQSQQGILINGGSTVDLGTTKLAANDTLKTIGRVRARSASSAFTPNQTIPQFTVSGSVLQAAQGKSSNANEQSILLAVPGFQTDINGQLILQGSLEDQIRYQFDGVDFTDPGFNRSANSTFFNGISSLQVVPGAGDPSQGNSGAGQVNLIVKRGTYPATGTADFELGSPAFAHQFNVQYGLASPNGRLSDFVSFFGLRNSPIYGGLNANSLSVNSAYSTAFTSTNDLVNNFVYRFGKDNAQSLQFLYLNDSSLSRGNNGGLQLFYPGNDPGTGPTYQGLSGLTQDQYFSLLGNEQGQPSQTSPLASNISNLSNTSLLKFEYDNQFNASTYLATRFFRQSSYSEGFGSGGSLQGPLAFLRTEQTAGGSRTGANFELNKQADAHNLLTLSGSFEFNRPTFDTLAPYLGLLDLQNATVSAADNPGGLPSPAVDFLRPPNPNMPVGPNNPCPVVGGCYLQQFFYQKGGTPRVPSANLRSSELQNVYGIGLRDQIQFNSHLRLDLGARYDLINEGFGPNLYYADENTQPVPGSSSTYFVPNYGFVERPHFIEPRAGLSYRFSNNDAASFTYGRAIILQGLGELASPEAPNAYSQFANIPANPNFIAGGDPFIPYKTITANSCFPFLPFPVGAGPNATPSYKGSVAKGGGLQFGKPCANYQQQLYAANDAFYPEVTAVQPGVFNEYDANFSHQFHNGSALKIAPFFRRGTQVQAITANLINVNGTFQPGTLTSQSVGVSTTTGLDVQFTLPDRPVGLTGFASLTYVNEFTNTPPSSDNPNNQAFEPLILPQSLAAGNLYRAGFVSPFTARFGASYRTRGGLRVNPILNVNSGFPIGSGLLTPILYQGRGINVTNTNVTDQFGANGSPQYVDPSNPGSLFSPNIAATRGTPEKANGGGVLSAPQVTADMTLEFSPPRSRSTFGIQVQNLFGNEYIVPPATGQVPVVNGNYLPVTTGVAGPLTGQQFNHLSVPTQVPLTYSALQPYGPYLTGVSNPAQFRFYYQYAL